LHDVANPGVLDEALPDAAFSPDVHATRPRMLNTTVPDVIVFLRFTSLPVATPQLM
jgi:hypothetical protein